ncbi:MAG: enoyl-CoA hydratase-related protein [Paralcaligenes sp.]
MEEQIRHTHGDGQSAQRSVTCVIEDNVATITLNRPHKLNSLNLEMQEALQEILREVAATSAVRAVLLTGAGRAFCAGQDLNERKASPGAAPRDLGRTIEQMWNPLARALRYLEIPVVCAVNGVAAGGGASIALAADIVFAARSAVFVQAFSKIGLIPDVGSTYYLPRLVGVARAMGMTMLSETVTAQQAERWGLIWRCVDDDELLATARDTAVLLAHGPTGSLGKLKRALYESLDNSFEDQLDLERRSQRACGFLEDYCEGVAAFHEKRLPKFTGK